MPTKIMKAVLVREKGGADQLALGEAPRPEAGPGELLVRVHATALNRADILQREGKYPPPPGASSLLGLEAAGVVEAVGAQAGPWRPGDRVCGLMGGGGYAEYAVLDAGLALPIPEAMGFAEAAAIPEVFLTAYQALHWLARVQPGEHVLIHAAASGVGTAALQLAGLAGAHAYATASAGKLPFCASLGAEVGIDYKTEDFAARMHEATGGHGADVIIDFVGGPNWEKNVRALALDGRMVLLAMLGGARAEGLDLRPFFAKRLSVMASTLRSRTVAYQARLTADAAALLLPAFEAGRLRPVIDRVYPWQEVAEAHRRMEANENIGKIVLQVA